MGTIVTASQAGDANKTWITVFHDTAVGPFTNTTAYLQNTNSALNVAHLDINRAKFVTGGIKAPNPKRVSETVTRAKIILLAF